MPTPRSARSRVKTTLIAASAFVAGSALSVTAVASAGAIKHHGDEPPAHPTSANQIQNVDQVKTAIKAYYGDTTTTTPDPSDSSKVLHEPSTTSAWAKETRGIAGQVRNYLARIHGKKFHHKKPVLLLDVDDTSLVTYDYEISSNFVYNPTNNAKFVNGAVFPPVQGVPQLAKYAQHHGYQVIWLTGRPESQRNGTVQNLLNAGYDGPDSDHLYLKDQSAPWLTSCAPSCTTVQYKSLTRQHIQTLGYKIVANVGDQYSDLEGGYAKRTFKMPNPMYYLP